MTGLLAAIPLPVWVLAPALVVLGWLWAATHTAPMDTDLWDGGEPCPDDAEPPLDPAWRQEVW